MIKLLINLLLFLVASVGLLLFTPVNLAIVLCTGGSLSGYFLSSATTIDKVAGWEFRALWNRTLIMKAGIPFDDIRYTMSYHLGVNQELGTLSRTGRIVCRLLDKIDYKHVENAVRQVQGKPLLNNPNQKMKKTIFESAYGWLLLLVTQYFSLPSVVQSLIVLALLFHVDLITGLCAAYKEAKQQNQLPKVYFVESKKLRSSVVKAVFYIFLVLGVKMISEAYGIQGVSLLGRDHEVVHIAVGVCIAIESWSVVENFKRLGYDAIGRITKTAKGVWKLLKAVKNEE